MLSFDSRLRIWSDFTNDLDRVRALLQHDILLSEPAALVESDAPSLVATIGSRQARDAATMEEALALVGRALEPLWLSAASAHDESQKTVILPVTAALVR